jgi:hypothetical protein
LDTIKICPFLSAEVSWYQLGYLELSLFIILFKKGLKIKRITPADMLMVARKGYKDKSLFLRIDSIMPDM